MQQLTLRFDSTRKLQQYMLEEAENGGIFCATTEHYELGETVFVTIYLPDIPEGVPLISSVIWRRRATKWRSSLVPGVGLAFDEASRPQLDFLLSHMAGSVRSTRRAWPRHNLELPIEVSYGERVYRSSTRDIGLGGMFVRFDAPCEVGSEVEVNVFPKGSDEPVGFHGKVAWTRGGEREPGFALAFPRGDSKLRRRAERIIIASDPPPPPDQDPRATATLWRKPRK
jgi:Tfp pilus assembly protein PilZ